MALPRSTHRWIAMGRLQQIRRDFFHVGQKRKQIAEGSCLEPRQRAGAYSATLLLRHIRNRLQYRVLCAREGRLGRRHRALLSFSRIQKIPFPDLLAWQLSYALLPQRLRCKQGVLTLWLAAIQAR